MSHLKRYAVPKRWPIERKGSKYVVRGNSDLHDGVPLLIILRDMLELVQNRREAKKTIHSRHIAINEKPAKDEKYNVLLLDTIKIEPLKKNYRLEISEKGKFCLNEISDKETNKKICKIVNKKMLKGKKTQINFGDGRNISSEIKCGINDSAVINLKESKIEKCLPLKEQAKVIIFAGKHAGQKGEIFEINKEEKTAIIKIEDRQVHALINQIMVVE